MLKRFLFACLCATGVARADTDTLPVLTGIHDCLLPRTGEPRNVKFEFLVTETGSVQDVHVVESSGDTKADQLAADCVATRKYTPATHNGVAVSHLTTSNLHWGRSDDLEGDDKAFAHLERDADHRCHRLYPVDRVYLDPQRPTTLVTVTRLPSGELQIAVTGSAGEKADRNAVSCLKDIVKEHDDLPAAFARTIAINWMHVR